MNRNNLLKRVPMFTDLDEGHLALLAANMGEQRFSRGATIFLEGSVGDALYFIIEGQVRIFITTATGQEISMSVFRQGDFFGELSLLDAQPRSASATVMQETRVLTLCRTAFLAILHDCPDMAVAVLAALSGRLRQSNHYTEYLISHSAPQRVVRRLLDMAEQHGMTTGDCQRIDLHLTQDDLASLSGTTRETVNRVLAGLREQGLIEIERARLSVLNLEQLESLRR